MQTYNVVELKETLEHQKHPCFNCGREKKYTGRFCRACQQHRLKYGVDRPLEFEEKRKAWSSNDTGKCTNCGRGINNKTKLCHTCFFWAKRHNGEMRPIEREERLKNPAAHLPKEKVKICGKCRYLRLKRDDPNARCRSCIMKQAWKEGKFENRPRTLKHRDNMWDEDEVKLLETLAGTMTAKEITARINREFLSERTEAAITVKAKTLGISLMVFSGYTLHQVVYKLGVAYDTVAKFIEKGLLKASQLHGAKLKGHWNIERNDLESFVREYPYLLGDRNRIRDRKLRDIAEFEFRKRPWVTRSKAAQILGITESTLANHVHSGRVKTIPEYTGKRVWWKYHITRDSLYDFIDERKRARI